MVVGSKLWVNMTLNSTTLLIQGWSTCPPFLTKTLFVIKLTFKLSWELEYIPKLDGPHVEWLWQALNQNPKLTSRRLLRNVGPKPIGFQAPFALSGILLCLVSLPPLDLMSLWALSLQACPTHWELENWSSSQEFEHLMTACKIQVPNSWKLQFQTLQLEL